MLKFKTPQFKNTFKFFDKLNSHDVKPVLDAYGKRGVSALSAATPVDTGETAAAWSYKIVGNPKRYKLIWTNSSVVRNRPIVLLIQYGHATKGGSWYPGQDFINPAIRPVFEDLNQALLKEIIR